MSADDHGVTDAAVMSMAPGARVAGYRLEERIGQGGMAVVFRAHDERLNRPVALKLLAPALAGNPELRQRFLSESRAAAAIDDPHIVPVFAAGEADGLLYIAMRYVAGGDAQSLLKREGPLPAGRAADVVSPVGSALDAAHRAGLVHRDVKPSNMLLDALPGRPAHVYLSDFGLSKSVSSTSGMTEAGAILGTLAYMSPEQVRSKPVDARSDQYALACSAFELLTGAVPFQRGDPASLMYAHLSVSPPSLTSRRPDLDPAADVVLARALAKEPGGRYASCGEFADALRGALGLRPYRSAPWVIPPEARPRARAPAHPPIETAARPPTETALVTAPEGPRPGDSLGDAAPVPPTRADEPVMDAGQPDDSGGTVRRRRLRGRIAATASVAAAGLAAGLLLVMPGAPSRPPPPAAVVVPITVKSANPPLTSDVYVQYGDTDRNGRFAHAEVSGELGKAASGEVAALYAQQFPYKSAPVKIGSVVVRPAGGTAGYAFQVTPTLATRYRVELFRSRTSPAPFAVSGTATVYVVLDALLSDVPDCTPPVCSGSMSATYLVPPSALRAEMSKTPYVYFAFNVSKKARPPVPQRVTLGAGNARVAGVQRLSADQFMVTVTFSFAAGAGYHTNYLVLLCLKDAVTADGVGFPGRHGCGNPSLPNSASYVG